MDSWIDRRNFMKSLGVMGAAAASDRRLRRQVYADEGMNGHRPNIVFIMTDQQRWDTIGLLGLSHAVTPHIDKLAENGVLFSKCHVQSAVCCPSRASLVSGLYVHTHGALSNGLWLMPGTQNWIEELRDAGYHTANIGKMHTKPVDLPCGFEYRFVVENKNHIHDKNYGDDHYEALLKKRGLERPGSNYFKRYNEKEYFKSLNTFVWPLEEELFPDNVVGKRSVDYINTHDFNEKPLFLWTGFAGPHDPYDVTESALRKYGDRPIPEPVTRPGELETKPPEQLEYMKRMDGRVCTACISWSYATPERIERLRRHYFANIMLIDEWVGEIVDAVRAKGQLDNTIFIFTSDHGDMLADHNLIYKFCSHYDPVVRVPLVISGPGIAKQGISDHLVEMIDVGPTVLSLAGVAPAHPYRGVSLTTLLTGSESPVHEAVFSEYTNRNMIRRGEWKMVHYSEKPYGELYNLEEDPYELNNLYSSTGHTEIRASLTDHLLDWFEATKFRT